MSDVKLTPSEIISRARSRLQAKKFFYYNLLKKWKMMEDDSLPSIAGVGWFNDSMYLVYRPEWVSLHSPEELMDIIEHEVSHFVFDHCQKFTSSNTPLKFKNKEEAADHVRQQELNQFEHKLNNIAQDRSINVYIPNLKTFKYTEPTEEGNLEVKEAEVITVETFKKLLTESGYQGNVDDVKQYESWQYYRKLLDECPNVQEQIEKIKQMDVHFSDGGDMEGDGEGSGKDKPDDSDVSRQIMEAYFESKDSEIPRHIASQIELAIERMKPAEIPWEVIFKRQLRRALKTEYKQDINVRDLYTDIVSQMNNGLDVCLPGYIDEPKWKIGVIFDVSGSCMDAQTQGKFWAEVMTLSKLGAQCTVYFTDAQVEKVQVIKKKSITEEDYEGLGGGGTDLDKGIVRSIEDGNTIHVMLTDCWMDYNLDTSDFKGNKVICVSTTDSKMPDHYGTTIHVENN
jgi:predicted metal-dependent peptidase